MLNRLFGKVHSVKTITPIKIDSFFFSSSYRCNLLYISYVLELQLAPFALFINCKYFSKKKKKTLNKIPFCFAASFIDRYGLVLILH